MGDLCLESMPIAALKPYERNARTHSRKQIKQIAASIERFGFNAPVLIDEDNGIIAGHGRVEAAKLLQLESVPTVRLSHLSDNEKRAYILADNKLATKAGWDREMLAIEVKHLLEVGIDPEPVGFETFELDSILDEAEAREKNSAPEDVVDPAAKGPAVSRPGDLWYLGQHRLLCGDARALQSYATLLGAEKAGIIITDPPYNVRIEGNVGGLGKVKHADFAMAAGEMSEAEFTIFLKTVFERLTASSVDGSIHYVFMDWRHIGEMLAAASGVYADLKNLCVWNKSVGGMGTFYRSKHELVFVFKHGTAPHVNNFELGQHGRSRTNVWDYDGVVGFRAGRLEEIAMHPTVKPVALIADALRDCSKRGAIVLDPFGGSGSTLIAAEKTGRRARLIELDSGLRRRHRAALAGLCRQGGHARRIRCDLRGRRRAPREAGARGIGRRPAESQKHHCTRKESMMSESNSNDDDLADEKVGYKKPPKATRFRKGQSGNPSGRPKKTSSLRESFREELSGPMLFKIGGEVKPFDSREAYARALVKSARRGSIADIKIILECDQAGDLAGALAEQQRQYRHPGSAGACRVGGGVGAPLRCRRARRGGAETLRPPRKPKRLA